MQFSQILESCLHHSHEMEALQEALSHSENLNRNFLFIFIIKESKDLLEIMNFLNQFEIYLYLYMRKLYNYMKF